MKYTFQAFECGVETFPTIKIRGGLQVQDHTSGGDHDLTSSHEHPESTATYKTVSSGGGWGKKN